MSEPSELDAVLVDHVMLKMSLTYGKRFLGAYTHANEQIRAHFAHELAGLSAASIAWMLTHLPADYVPNVLQLRALASQRPADPPERALPWQPSRVPSQAKAKALRALQDLQQQYLTNITTGVNIAWAQRIHDSPQGRSKYARELAEQVLRAHGKLPP